MISLGIESTAHTFGVGIVEDEKILADVRSVFRPEKGGIHPSECAAFHEKNKDRVLKEALEQSGLSLDNIDIVSYSKGPGIPPCLKAGLELAKTLKKPLIEVNHCVAHIEIGRMETKCKDPIVLYVSGGNTQVIGFSSGRYRIFGETLDIAVGNAIDTFMREAGYGFPGGPVMEKMATGKYIELPYVVKGMDLSFSGILTSALKKFKEGAKIEDMCFSFQETCYSMLTEVTERALSQTGRIEVLITGGVAASRRLREMMETMCQERGATCFSVSKELSADNGVMIAYTGLIAFKAGQKPSDKPDFERNWRTDDVEVLWV